MSTLTQNYNLVKPDLTDPADVTAWNGNWDIIDDKLAKTAPIGYVEGVFEVNTLDEFNAKIVELESTMAVRTIKKYIITKKDWNNTVPSGDYFVEIRKAWNGYTSVVASAVCNGNQIVLHRTLDTGSWQDWEWENPLLSSGVEYRTTERRLEKPVYTKLMTLTWAKDTVHTISNFEGKAPFKYVGKVGTWLVPFMYQGKLDGDYSAIVSIHKNNDDLKIGMYGGSSINGTLELQIWYTKE